MTKREEVRFSGFSPETLRFLEQLAANNNKPWFNEHKQEYIEFVLEPFRDLVQDLSEFMLDIDPDFETRPMVDKTISRIYRDTRFSRDKSPYRSNLWLTFKRPEKNWQGAPVYFFELAPDWYRYGMGYYSASKATMDRLRERIDRKPKEFNKILTLYKNQSVFELEGEKYKRVLDDSKPAEVMDWYQRRNICLICNEKPGPVLFSRKLTDEIRSGFKLLAPLYCFFRELAP